jgi:tRNA(adenine34) deaminase
MLTDTTDTDLQAMRLAIEASEHAAAKGDGPFGATLVSPDGHILLVAPNNAKTAADCTGHAEMVSGILCITPCGL